MSAILARTLAVLVLWAIAFVGAVAAGAQPRPAELAAAIGAGITLLVWGLLGDRPAVARAKEPAAAAPPPPRERERDAV